MLLCLPIYFSVFGVERYRKRIKDREGIRGSEIPSCGNLVVRQIISARAIWFEEYELGCNRGKHRREYW
jgi:hypothetical protein